MLFALSSKCYEVASYFSRLLAGHLLITVSLRFLSTSLTMSVLRCSDGPRRRGYSEPQQFKLLPRLHSQVAGHVHTQHVRPDGQHVTER